MGLVIDMEAGGVYGMPEGTWSDDSSMALATFASIIEKKEVIPADVLSRFVKWEMEGEYKPALEALLQKGIDDGLKYYGRDLRNLTEMAYLGRLFYLSEFKAVPEELIKTTGYVIDSIEAAIWCLITTDSYKECMLKAVNLGDDTDTVAAIAGGLAGLFYGYEAIPKEWLTVIKKHEWIKEMCAEMEQ